MIHLSRTPTCLFIFSLLLTLSACGSTESNISLPPGFSLNLYADKLPGARQMALGEQGTVFVGSNKGGKIYALINRNNAPRAEKTVIISNDLELPTGVAVQQDTLYVAGLNKIIHYKQIEKQLFKASKPQAQLLTSTLPGKSHHGRRVLEFSPDGKLYATVGMPCNICELQDPYMGSILQINLESGKATVYASGVRNSVGLAWQPDTHKLWFTDNGRDWLGNDLPPDELNIADKPGMHFGFPYYYGNNQTEEDYQPKQTPFQATPPALALQAHSAPLGLSFYTGDMFPGEYKDSLFIAQHGSWNRAGKVGYQVLNVKLKGDKVISSAVFAQGWLTGQSASGQPVDILQLQDGSILISDDKAGVIYRASYHPPPAPKHIK